MGTCRFDQRSSFFFTVISILLLSLVTLLPGCEKKVEEVKIGAIIPLTGPFASYGDPVRDGMLLALEEINKAGGIRGKVVKLVIEDDAGDPKSAVNAFNKLASSDKVFIILGPLSSGSSMATAPVAEQRKVVQLSTLAGIPALSEAGDYVFRIYPSSEVSARFAAYSAFKKFSPRRIAILYMNNPFGETARKTYSAVAKEYNAVITLTESFPEGEKDFRTQLSKIKSSRPDIIFCSAYWQEGSSILVQMQELGLDMPVIGEDGWRGPIANIVGEKGLSQLYFSDISFGAEFKNNRIMQTFISRYEKRYGKKASTYAATGYDAVYVAKTSIEQGDNSGDGIKKALYGLSYSGALGTIRFDRNGDDVGLTFSVFQLNTNNDAFLAQE